MTENDPALKSNSQSSRSSPALDRVPIAVCVGSWLPLSETFIYDQLTHQRRTQAWVIARGVTPHREQFPYNDVVNVGPVEQVAYYHMGFSPKVSRAFRSRETALVHAHFGLNGTMILPFAEKEEVPLVVSFHGHDVGGLEAQNRLTSRYFRYQRLAQRMFDYSSLLLCASTELAESLIAHGAPEQKVVVHHLGVDTRSFSPPPVGVRQGKGCILMVGRLVEKKGMEYGIEAFSRVFKRFTAARLRIVGTGPLLSRLRRLANAWGVGERVEFLGGRSPAEVRQFMAEADVILTPSVTTASGDRESGVIVLKEAGAMGLPAVATQHGGIPEIVDDGTTGFLVAERDVDGLTRRLEELLGDQLLRESMGQSARRLIEVRYDTLVQNEKLENHLLAAAR